MKLYFAGPMFTTPERTWNAEVAAALRAAGHEVFLPQEQEPGKDAPGIFATDVGGIDWAEGVVAIVDGPDPDSGTAWEVGYAFGVRKPILLIRTDLRTLAGKAGDYNPMLAQAATSRVDAPARSTTEVIGAVLDALTRIETVRGREPSKRAVSAARYVARAMLRASGGCPGARPERHRPAGLARHNGCQETERGTA